MRAILQESVRIYGGSKVYRRTHLVYLSLLSVLVLILWPNAPYIQFFKLSAYPPGYEILSIVALLLLSAGSLYVGKTSFARRTFVSNTDWIEKTTVPIVSLVGGRVVAGVSHTVGLASVAFPFLVLAAGPSGASLGAVGSTLVVITTSALACRFAGMWIDAGLERRPMLSVLTSWLALGLIFILSIEIFPDMNPIIAVAAIAGEPDLSFATFRMTLEPLYLRSVLILGLLSSVSVGATGITLVLRRRRYRRHLAALRRVNRD